MIITRAHDFGFVHIPKCAGSSIRNQLRDKDDLDQRFYQTMVVPGVGRINANHIPLAFLERHFADEWAQLCAVTRYTVVRAPHDRFHSAVAQYLRAYHGEPGEMNTKDITAHTREIIAAIQADPHMADIRNTIFMPQVDFIYLRGERQIDHVFAMENLDPFFDRLETQHGLVLERDQVWNASVTFRVPGSGGLINRAKDSARRMLPTQLYARLRDAALPVLATKGVPRLTDTLEQMPQVQAFVDSFYAADIALYRAVLAGDVPRQAPDQLPDMAPHRTPDIAGDSL